MARPTAEVLGETVTVRVKLHAEEVAALNDYIEAHYGLPCSLKCMTDAGRAALRREVVTLRANLGVGQLFAILASERDKA